MRSRTFQILVYCVTVCFTLHSLFGCSSSKATSAYLDNYKDEPYVDTAGFVGHKDDIYKAAIGALQSKRYLITASDTATGRITAELNRISILPEDRKDTEEKAKSGAEGSNVIVAILGIILVVGIIAMILHSTSSNNETSQSISSSESSESTESIESSESTTNSFTYIVTISMAPLGSDSTEVRIDALRTDFENGNTLSRTPLSNRYLNYSIFDAIDEEYKSSIP